MKHLLTLRFCKKKEDVSFVLNQDIEANQCASTKSCRRCSGKHHQSICNQHAPREATTPSRQSQQTRNNSNDQEITSTENSNTPDTHTTYVQQESKPRRANTIGGVMLQTATAIASSKDGTGSMKVKILFNSGSQRSYISDKLKSRLNLQPKRTERLHLNTFGERNFRNQKCDVVTLSLQGKTRSNIRLSALSFPVICSPF